MQAIATINLIFGILIAFCFGYHWFLVLLNFIKKPKTYPDAEPKKYAILVSARDEESVIGHLLDSLKKQDYPADKLDIYVVADNCTDNTIKIAKSYGAYVYERTNDKLLGKAHALNELLHHIWDTVGKGVYDGYFVFDADNVVNNNFVKEINKVISSGKRIVVGYRNYKGKFKTWISYCYDMYWLREAVQINRGRNAIGVSATINGTGYCITEDILLRDDGFCTKTLTEDCEMTLRWIIRGEKIILCDTAILYDEQPSKFSSSCKQRARWVKGSIQCYFRYFFKLICGCFKKKSAKSCLDQLIYIFLPLIFSVISFVLNLILGIPQLVSGSLTITTLLITAGIGLGASYLYTMLLPLFAIITERKHIRDSKLKCVLYTVFYPIFMVTYIPLLVYGLFAKITWTPIKHTKALSIEDVERLQK